MSSTQQTDERERAHDGPDPAPAVAEPGTPAEPEPARTDTAAPDAPADRAAAPARDAAEPKGAKAASEPETGRPGLLTRIPRLALAATAAVALAAAATFGILWATDDSAAELETLRADLATDAAAAEVASRYALSVSQVAPGDIEGWRTSLQTDVSAELAPKLSAAVDVVGPWLTQMEYTSTAKVLAAQVAEREGDLYTVQVFVDMTSRSRQTPDGVTATAAYTVTMDRAANWTITDVGGVTPDLPGAAPADPAPR